MPAFSRRCLLSALLVASCAWARADSVPIESGLSGGWWNPSRSGEGFQIEVLSASSAVAIWYTYPAVDDPQEAEQLWIGGPGRIEGDRIVIDPALVSRGPRFGPEYEREDLVQEEWGRLSFTFSDCDHGSVDYAGLPGYGSGRIVLQRLTGNPRLPCAEGEAPANGPTPDEPPAPAPPSPSVPGLSGTWYDPAYSGQGWFLQEIAEGMVVVMWFSYDGQGRPAHFLAIGELQGRSLVARGVQRARGTFFGADFDRTDVVREHWGDLHIVFDSCVSATLSWRSPLAEFGSGLLLPRRLTRSESLPCAFPALRDPGEARWQASGGAPALSEVPAAVLDGAVYVAGGFGGDSVQTWRFDPTTATWTRRADLPAPRHHGHLAAHGGHLYFFGGFITQPVVGFVPRPQAWRYEPGGDAWSPIAPLPVGKGAGTAIAAGAFIYVVGGHPHTALRYEPAQNRWSELHIEDDAPRDHSAAVLYQDEIWILGGRDHADGMAHNRVAIFNPLTGTSREGPRMRHARSGFGATVFDGRILVAGGEDLLGPSLTASAELYDPETRAWREIAAPPHAVHGVAAAASDGKAWMLLGSVAAGGISNPGIVQAFGYPPTATASADQPEAR